MHPELLNLGFLTIHTYGFFYALGILAAIVVSEFLNQRSGEPAGVITDLALPVVVGVVLGARVLFILVEHQYFRQHPLEIFMFWKGGLVFYGGLMGGAAAFFLTVRKRGLNLWKTADTLAPGLALGHALGRLGCFFAGSCYGRPTDVPWAVTFTDPKSLAGAVLGIPVHPTQLYSSGFLFLLSALLVFTRARKGFQGQVAIVYALLYGSFRFLVEFLRGDPRGEATLFGLTLSTSQWISVLLVAAAVTGYHLLSGNKEVHHGPGKVLFQDQA